MSSSSSRLVVGLSRVWLSLGLVFALTATLLMGSPAPAGAVAGYGDVPESTWYTDAVQWSVDNAITDIAGVCFGIDTPVSRGETAVWIYNMENQPDAGEPHSFIDVTDASQDDAISWMANNEITTGTSPTTFAPDETLRRAQVAAFLHRLKREPPAPPHGFVDVVAAWQQDAVSWMAHSGITTGTTPTTFAPEDTLTRAQLITFLYRYQDEPDVTVNTSTPHCDPTTDTPENPADTPTEPTEESIASSIADAEAHMVSLVNELRKSLDVAPLEQHDDIASVARRWSNTMHENDDFKHNPGWRAEYPAGWVTGGENIGRVSYHGDLISEVERAFDGLSDSPGHYQNMIRSSFGQIGVGIAVGNGSVWVTQNFACYPPTGSTSCEAQDDSPSTTVARDESEFLARDTRCDDYSGDGRYSGVTVGPEFVYALRHDGKIVCFDFGTNWLPTVPNGAYSSITVGSDHACALRLDKSIACWTTIPNDALREYRVRQWYPAATAPVGQFREVVAGDDHSCAVRTDGTVTCWGLDSHGETEAPSGEFTTVAAGVDYSCGLRVNGTVACWGHDWGGLVSGVPEGQFTSLSAADVHICGLRVVGTINCKGGRAVYFDIDNQIPGTEPVTNSAVKQPPSGRFKYISTGTFYACGIREDDVT